MSSRRHTPEQIINKLRQAEVELVNGATVAQVPVARWRRHYNTEKTKLSLKRSLGFLR